MLCWDEVFEELVFRYVGGLWVMVEFISKESCKNFLANKSLDPWLLDKCPWDRNIVPTDQLVWLDVEGLPLCVWSKGVFHKIVEKWGSIAHIDDDLGEDVYKKRLCVLNSCQDIISEVVKVWLDDMSFNVRIKEAPVEILHFHPKNLNLNLMIEMVVTYLKIKKVFMLVMKMRKKVKECLGDNQLHIGNFLHVKKSVDHANKKNHIIVQNSIVPMTTTPFDAIIVHKV
ncbi:unnamed protein product [Lactuca saligna]|uniref:DUF4283 domain-containing protein n=1 Tax=Lactuca saligna TaxID=75948 RepID=A0AA35YI48_LACSI|nr:unnamed protein product [Lactuca saligna]